MCWPPMWCVAFQKVDKSETHLQECVQCSCEGSAFAQLKRVWEPYLCPECQHMLWSNQCVCMIIAKVNNQSFFDCRFFSICKWKFTWTRLLGKPDVITLRMLLASLYKAFNGKAGSHSSGTAWIKNNISRMRTEIYILTKQCLLGTMIIIEKYTLFRCDGIEWACVLS